MYLQRHTSAKPQQLSVPTNCILKFTADWCGPCKRLAPYVAEVEKTLKTTLVTIDIDTDEGKELAEKYGITSIPVVIFLEKGIEIARHVGGNDVELCVLSESIKHKYANQISLPVSTDATVKI